MAEQQTLSTASNDVHKASNDKVSKEKPLAGPKTYIDPAADVVLRSNCGREFRVVSYMLKAASPKFRTLLETIPGDPIDIDADRKTLKLFLDMIHVVPMPGAFVWSMRDRLFPLIDQFDSDMAAHRALALLVECPERDPWAMFVLAGKHTFPPLAHAALFALARKDVGEYGDFGGMRIHTLEGVTSPFMLGLLNAVMSASKDRAPVTWASVATRFAPVFPYDDDTAAKVAKKEFNKALMVQQLTRPRAALKMAKLVNHDVGTLVNSLSAGSPHLTAPTGKTGHLGPNTGVSSPRQSINVN